MFEPVFDDFNDAEIPTEEKVWEFMKRYGIGLRYLCRLINMDPSTFYLQVKGTPKKKTELKQSTLDRINQLYGTKFQVNPGSKASKHNPPAAPDGSDAPPE